MSKIRIKTYIKANREIVFNLKRSIDLHKLSTVKSKEEAIGGKTDGLIGLNEWVTWRAKHFGMYHRLTSKVTKFQFPDYFVDEMQKGIFKYFRHEHHFRAYKKGTMMIDIFDYASPLGFLGKLADWIFVKKYMANFLISRNQIVKEYAETGKWKTLNMIF